jgi:hypothetical protein
MDKKTFLDIVTNYDPKEINDLIKAKGKKPKLICPVLYFSDSKPV